MRTLTVQNMGNGFEIETPSFGYWVKAGMAATLGFFIVSLVVAVVYLSLFTIIGIGVLRSLTH